MKVIAVVAACSAAVGFGAAAVVIPRTGSSPFGGGHVVAELGITADGGVAVGDWNLDGFADFVVKDGSRFCLFGGDGAGHFTQIGSVELAQLGLDPSFCEVSGMQMVDTNGDGAPDLILYYRGPTQPDYSNNHVHVMVVDNPNAACASPLVRKSDLNGDGVVNSGDLCLLLGSWGPVCQ